MIPKGPEGLVIDAPEHGGRLATRVKGVVADLSPETGSQCAASRRAAERAPEAPRTGDPISGTFRKSRPVTRDFSPTVGISALLSGVTCDVILASLVTGGEGG